METKEIHPVDLHGHDGYFHPVDELVTKLSRPIYNLRMANGMRNLGRYTTKSARTRAINARREIHDIVKKYQGDEE